MAGARDADVALGLTVKLAASAAGSGGRAPYAQTTRAVEYAFDITSFFLAPPLLELEEGSIKREQSPANRGTAEAGRRELRVHVNADERWMGNKL